MSLSNLSRKELRNYDQLHQLDENDRITRRIERIIAINEDRILFEFVFDARIVNR